jgi:hypothetical protein
MDTSTNPFEIITLPDELNDEIAQFMSSRESTNRGNKKTKRFKVGKCKVGPDVFEITIYRTPLTKRHRSKKKKAEENEGKEKKEYVKKNIGSARYILNILENTLTFMVGYNTIHDDLYDIWEMNCRDDTTVYKNGSYVLISTPTAHLTDLNYFNLKTKIRSIKIDK